MNALIIIISLVVILFLLGNLIKYLVYPIAEHKSPVVDKMEELLYILEYLVEDVQYWEHKNFEGNYDSIYHYCQIKNLDENHVRRPHYWGLQTDEYLYLFGAPLQIDAMANELKAPHLSFSRKGAIERIEWMIYRYKFPNY